MSTKETFVLALAIVIGGVIAGIVAESRKPERPVASGRISQLEPTPAPLVSEPTPPPQIPAAESPPPVQTAKHGAPPLGIARAKQRSAANPSTSTSQAGQPARAKEPIQDPDARVALSFVGADPDAEQYWVAAINNPKLGPNERKDLIEDLNEDGLSDPKHPGPEDLPLIVNRLQLIEELAPYAMDQVNADAFAEAYKDLANMLDGRPVQ
jgi:hypothetical protein